MAKDNVIQKKSFDFALRIIKWYKYLVEERKEYILSKQILRCGTSIGANVEEALGGQSRKDFISKMSIAYKEARETDYWIRLLTEGGCIERNISKSLLEDCAELLKIISKILTTSKQKDN